MKDRKELPNGAAIGRLDTSGLSTDQHSLYEEALGKVERPKGMDELEFARRILEAIVERILTKETLASGSFELPQLDPGRERIKFKRV